MVERIILLSGPVVAGKSTLGDMLSQRKNIVRIKTHELIQTINPELSNDRDVLQIEGAKLDKRTKGKWVCDALLRRDATLDPKTWLVVDSVRIREQIDEVRRSFGSKVFHIHITATEGELRRRFKKRTNRHVKEVISFEKVLGHPTEAQVHNLSEIADVVVHSDRCDPEDVLIRATALLGLYPRTVERKVDVIVGGQYGSEGKGNIAAYLAPEYQILVRVGGPNAGHKVYGDPIRTYRHLPSGTDTALSADLILGPSCLINTAVLQDEISKFSVTSKRLSISPNAMIITKAHMKAEAISDGMNGISSTLQGVGAALAAKIIGRGGGVVLAKDIPELKPYLSETAELLEDAYRDGKSILLEGTQGTSLSLYHGNYPHVTSRDTTVAGCLSEAGIAPNRVRRSVMVCRTYPIRVGGPSGPMKNEIKRSEIIRRSRLPKADVYKTERTTTTDKPRRISEFDWGQLHQSAVLNGPTDIALTFVDYLAGENRKARRFDQLDQATIQFIDEVERVAGTPVSLISTRFDYRNIIDRRAWKS